jgi:hypothetical protein
MERNGWQHSIDATAEKKLQKINFMLAASMK